MKIHMTIDHLYFIFFILLSVSYTLCSTAFFYFYIQVLRYLWIWMLLFFLLVKCCCVIDLTIFNAKLFYSIYTYIQTSKHNSLTYSFIIRFIILRYCYSSLILSCKFFCEDSRYNKLVCNECSTYFYRNIIHFYFNQLLPIIEIPLPPTLKEKHHF